MSYAVLNVKKFSAGKVSGLQKHNQREYKNHSNQDIDKSRSYLNYDLINNQNINYTKRWKEHKDKFFVEGNRFRKDTIVVVEGVLTSDKNFFQDMDSNQIKKFFQDNLEFIKKEYGENNIMYARVHLDETTPHMHFGFTPITKDGRFSAKEIIGNRSDLRRLQDKYHRYLTDKGYELLRGVTVEQTQAKHKSAKEYKKNQIDKDLEQIINIKSELDSLTKKYNEIVTQLNENSLNIHEINSISIQESKGLFKSDNYVKVKKLDYEKLKKSAIKAYEQHSLYATVNEDLKNKDRLIDLYENQNEKYRLKWQDAIYEKNNYIHGSKQSYEKKLNFYEKELNDYKKFITENKSELNFEKFKQKEKEKYQKKLQIKKSKSMELEL